MKETPDIRDETEKTISENKPVGKDDSQVAEEAGRGRWNIKGTCFFCLLFCLTLATLLFVIILLSAPENNRHGRVKIEAAENAPLPGETSADNGNTYELSPFFISLNKGENFLRLKITITHLDDGWDEKIMNNSHLYRGAVMEVFEGMHPSDLKFFNKQARLKKEIISEFIAVSKGEFSGEIIFSEFVIL